MPDTTAAAEREWRARLSRLTPEERYLLGVRMFEFAKEAVRAGVRSDCPDLTSIEVEREVLLRFHRGRVDDGLLALAAERLVAHLSSKAHLLPGDSAPR